MGDRIYFSLSVLNSLIDECLSETNKIPLKIVLSNKFYRDMALLLDVGMAPLKKWHFHGIPIVFRSGLDNFVSVYGSTEFGYHEFTKEVQGD